MTNDDEPELTERDRIQASQIAKRAMEQARESAKERGSRPRSARQASRDRADKQRASGVDRVPYGDGREPTPLGAQISAVFARMGWTEQIEVSSVTARWREVVGEKVADHCEPEKFDDGVLVVRTSSTAWATQVAILADKIRHRLNEEIGRDVVKEIKVAGPTQRSWKKGPRSVPGRGPRDTYG